MIFIIEAGGIEYIAVPTFGPPGFMTEPNFSNTGIGAVDLTDYLMK